MSKDSNNQEHTIAQCNTLEKAETVRKHILSNTHRVWVLVFAESNDALFEVAIMNDVNGKPDRETITRCESLVSELFATAPLSEIDDKAGHSSKKSPDDKSLPYETLA